AYTRAELHTMLEGRFRVLEETRIGFPRRVFPLDMPTWAHRMLSRWLGLMIVLRCQKIEAGQRELAGDGRVGAADLVTSMN
ncbi:MAG: hypothetical protein ACRD68_06220, partial [Pyrinomonadaceae bacterium]